MVSQKVERQVFPSFRRKPESSYFKMFWTPAFAGVTTQETFCEFIRVEVKQDLNLSLLTAIGTKS